MKHKLASFCAVKKSLFEVAREYFLATFDRHGRMAHIDLGVMVPPAQGWKITHPDSELDRTPHEIKSIAQDCMEDALTEAGEQSKRSRAVCQVQFQQSSATPKYITIHEMTDAHMHWVCTELQKTLLQKIYFLLYRTL
jgi:hypothetical protein